MASIYPTTINAPVMGVALDSNDSIDAAAKPLARTPTGLALADNVLAGKPPATKSHFLDSAGTPDGISQCFVQAAHDFPLRLWIVDNSGSMSTCDGKRLVHGLGGREAIVQASRWAELGDSITYHAQVAASLGAPTEFRLLNSPGNRASQVVRVGSGGDLEAQLEAVRRMVGSAPCGRTPLCAQIKEVTQMVAAQADALRANGQRACVVIASDGAATDGDVVAAMRPLQHLPAWVVVRLCTDDERVLRYWNAVDEDLELEMEVLDDLGGEAAEVGALNGWLTYGHQLHRLREWGCSSRVFDLLDEKGLGAAEMRELVELLLGPPATDLPDPQLDYDAFEAALKPLLASQSTVWCPRARRQVPWVDERKLRRAYRHQCSADGCHACSIM